MKNKKENKNGIFKKILWTLSPIPNRPKRIIWSRENEAAKNIIMDSLNTIRVKPNNNKNKESFDESVRRLNLSENDLYNREKFFMIGFYIVFAALAVSVLATIKCVMDGNSLGAFAACGSTTMFLNISLMWSYRFWMVNNRYFGSFWEYIKSMQYFPILQGD